MAGLKETATWENHIYQIEENDPVHGGENGITNKPNKQLANRTVYLRKGLTEAGQRLNPKKITATSRNSNDLTGHSHEIDLASLTTKGIVQLTNDTGLDSESLALTAKGAKKLATDIANVQLAANAKYTERPATTTQTGTVQLNNTLTSTATNQALTAAQGKALNDKLTPVNVYKVPVKSGTMAVTFDLTNRAHWIAEIGAVYKGSGHYQLTFHNNNVSNIANLPLSDKSPVQLDISIMGAFSLVRCHYFYLNRTFTTRVDWNNATFTLAWFEDLKLDNNRKVPRETVFAGSVESNYRMVVRRNQANLSPYYWLVNNAVNVDNSLPARTTLGTIDFKAGKNGTNDSIEKARLGVVLLADKNAEFEISAKNAEERWVRYLTAFSKTGNVHIGHSADNQRDRLQINGTAKATAPDANANNNQLPTTAWVRNYALGKSGNQTLDGNFTVGKANEWHKLKFPSGKGAFFLETNPASANDVANSIRFNMKFEQTGQTTKYLSFPEFPVGETVAYRSWVNTGLNGKVDKASNDYVKRIGNNHNIQLFWSHKGLEAKIDNTFLGEMVFVKDIHYQKIGNFEIRRYPDGTMIQTYVIHQYDFANWNEKSFNWANAFVETPLILTKATITPSTSHDADVTILTKSNSTTCYYREYEHWGVNQEAMRVQFLAIGRWK